MSDLAVLIEETAEMICDKFCKFGGTGDENGCVWCQIHENQCPFDDLLKEIGNDLRRNENKNLS